MFLSKAQNGFYYIYFTTKDGRRRKKSTRTENRSLAKQALTDFIRNYTETEKSLHRIDLKKFCWDYLKYTEAHFTWKTTLTYRTTFNKLNDYMGRIFLEDITQRQIEEFIQHRIITSSAYSARKDLSNIKASFSKAVEWNYLESNPADKIKRVKVPEKLPTFFSKEEFDTLISIIDDNLLRDIVNFAVNTGMRQSEILNLRRDEVDLSHKIIILSNKQHLTKTKRIRRIPMNDTVRDIIKRRLELGDDFIFAKTGKPFKQDYIVHKFKKLVRQAKLNDKLSFHSLRHTFASWLVQKGVPLYEVSKLLGHSNIKTTEIYAHLNTDDLRNAVEMLG